MSVYAAFVSERIYTQNVPRWDGHKSLFVLESIVWSLSFECFIPGTLNSMSVGQCAARLTGQGNMQNGPDIPGDEDSRMSLTSLEIRIVQCP